MQDSGLTDAIQIFIFRCFTVIIWYHPTQPCHRPKGIMITENHIRVKMNKCVIYWKRKRASRGATKQTSHESTTAAADTVDGVPASSLLLPVVCAAEWDRCTSNKLHSVKPSLGYCNFTHLNRRDAVILRRLRIGHTHLTHQYLLLREEPPQWLFI